MIPAFTGAPSRCDNAAVERGEVSKTNYSAHTMHSAASSHVKFCQCRINPVGCLVCRHWDRTIRGIDARRSDSLGRKALGMLSRTGR